ncbi:MAG: HAD-IA family hydrolase [Actinomycetia bacterium]|nr:HAD-IA family hydrolase [Actinomycetes bacterium]
MGFASACQADFDIVVTVNEDGSGLVETTTEIDAEATDGLLDPDTSGLLLADLAQSGWVIERPEQTSGGSTVITASKEFGTASQFAEVMAELTGNDGPIRDFHLIREKSFARVEYEITGTIDTSVDLDTFADQELEQALGQSLSAVAARYGAAEEHVNFRMEIVLPGEIQSEAPTGLMDSEAGLLRSEWKASLADDDVVPVVLSSATREVSALVLRGVAVVAGVLALLFAFAQVLRILLPDRRRRPGRRRPPTPPDKPAPTMAGAGATGDEEPPEAENEYRVVALDAMGVLYREGNDIQTLLIPFARQRGATASDEEIVAKAQTLTLGRMTTGQFWTAIGVRGEAAELDANYLSLHQLTPGVIKYLRSLRDNGIRSACITNDSAAWAAGLKTQHDLEGLIDPWVVSGIIGVRKPDRPIYEVLRRLTGEPPSAIQIIDDNLDLLDAARELGFATAWFNPDGVLEDTRGHPLIRRFDVGEEEPADLEAP